MNILSTLNPHSIHILSTLNPHSIYILSTFDPLTCIHTPTPGPHMYCRSGPLQNTGTLVSLHCTADLAATDAPADLRENRSILLLLLLLQSMMH